MRELIAELKRRANRLSKSGDLFISQLKSPENPKEFIEVIKDNFYLCFDKGVVDIPLIRACRTEFELNQIFLDPEELITAGCAVFTGGRYGQISGTAKAIATCLSRVDAHDRSILCAKNFSSVETYDTAYAVVSDKVSINAYGFSKVEASGNAIVTAGGFSTILAGGEANVSCFDNARIIANGRVSIEAFGKSYVIAGKGVEVEAHENAIVRSDNGIVCELNGNAKFFINDKKEYL